jgi:hypothetical protein
LLEAPAGLYDVERVRDWVEGYTFKENYVKKLIGYVRKE